MQISKISSIQKLIDKEKVDAMLISSVPNIIYLTDYAGFSEIEREAYLLITKTSNHIFTDGRYITAVRNKIPNFIVNEISGKKSFVECLESIFEKENLEIIGFEADNITVGEFLKIKKVGKKMKAVSLHDFRIKKTEKEKYKIKTACDLSALMYQHGISKLKLGITEKEIATEMEIFIKKEGFELSFPTIVAFGENAAIPHHMTSDKRLTTNSWVLIDFGVKFQNYCSDMTRTTFFGNPSAKQRQTYKTVLGAQTKAINYLKSSIINLKSNRIKIKLSEVDKVARDYIISQGYASIPHSLGHGIGIEVHEAPTLSPKSNDALEEGMVFSIEPGIYLPNIGGVRIEDLFTIQKGRLIQLTSPQSPSKI